jgi:hypothetical protein
MDSIDSKPSPLTAPSPSKSASTGCFKWFSITIIAAMTIVGFVWWKSVQALVSAPAEFVDRLMKGFKGEQTLVQSFRESLISVMPTHGDVLELATLEMDETVTRYDMKTLVGNRVYLGTTVSEIRVPAVYRYHIKINEEWRVTRKDHICTVVVPILHASQPPAIRTDKMEKKSESGWLRFNAADNLAELEKSLTPTLEKRADNTSHKDLARESARKAVAEFVQKWLLKQSQWASDEISSIVVVFADEESAKDPAALQRQKPVLTLP